MRGKAQRDIVTRVLHILRDAWPTTASDTRISRESDEDAITNVLRWHLVAAKNRLDPVPEMEFIREPQSDRAELDTPLGLIDIMVSYTWDESTYLTMECKRISSSGNSLALKYIRNGINRFASGKYSAGHSFGILVGYVTCKNPPGCVERIRNTLLREPATETGFDSESGFQAEKNLVDGLNLFKTRHRQQTQSNVIELFHTFVDFN